MDADPIRVLVVDDHALHRDGTRQILEQEPDLEVVGDAESGELALAMVSEHRPTVVLMDIRLPGMSGIEATRRISERHPDVRVLVVTAYDDDEYVRGALEAGAAGYLIKTVAARELVEAVRAVATGNAVLQPGLLHSLLADHAVGADNLTERELAVLRLIADGLRNKQIATRLGISARTVERHCDNIYGKLGVGSRTEAVVRALSNKLVRVADDPR
ncbi:MAG: response regulator transcription factor [Candidatus Nanopelagicales bacterium]|nr:response regulator transcription factor [Candidatus Nanopelagicales bacterium]MDZ4250007.1 response regulator transcription factor [Candidatus Nanopelagicales bacterium]MDZ7578966.1 response regulator transcription factor [Candidatus Nanopelagicales bacterium]